MKSLTFNISQWRKATKTPARGIKTAAGGSLPHCTPPHSHFPPLSGGLLRSGWEYWCRLCGHDGKCQWGWGHFPAELTALKRFSRTLQSTPPSQKSKGSSPGLNNFPLTCGSKWQSGSIFLAFKEAADSSVRSTRQKKTNVNLGLCGQQEVCAVCSNLLHSNILVCRVPPSVLSCLLCRFQLVALPISRWPEFFF